MTNAKKKRAAGFLKRNSTHAGKKILKQRRNKGRKKLVTA